MVGVDEVAAECRLDDRIVGSVLEAFALRGGNVGFATASDFSGVVATPLIRVDTGRYLLYQNYTLAEAIYTTPSYWMAEDGDYRDTHGEHRGRFTERLCEKRLSAVFGRGVVFVQRILGPDPRLGDDPPVGPAPAPVLHPPAPYVEILTERSLARKPPYPSPRPVLPAEVFAHRERLLETPFRRVASSHSADLPVRQDLDLVVLLGLQQMFQLQAPPLPGPAKSG